MSENKPPYVLGLDLGSNSIGWATVAVDGDLRPIRLMDMGVRLFPAGTDGDIEHGKDESRAVKRRGARLLRRQHDRRARRIDFIHLLLQDAGLLPPLPADQQPVWKQAKLWRKRSKTARRERTRLRRELLDELDQELLESVTKWNERNTRINPNAVPQRMPYFLRAMALDEKLPLHALGRALYHLAHRRGYLSNRKSQTEEDNEGSVVKTGIQELRKEMQEYNHRTLGELFLHKPESARLRGRWTARDMFLEEFEKIWAAQQPHHADILTEALHLRLRRAIFRQRPLKSAAGLIGFCEWEKDCRRAPTAILPAQRFRYLQQLNHLRITADGVDERPLLPKEREKVIEYLEYEGDLPFTKLSKFLNLKRVKTNFENGGEKKLIGNRTSAKLAPIFGMDRWKDMPEEEKEKVIQDWRQTVKDETLKKRGMKAYSLDEEMAGKFASVSLEDGYIGLSREALARILPHLEEGLSYMEACKKEYGDRAAPQVNTLLPPAPMVRNPVVDRVLTELRKVVNALVRRNGKPAAIRIEMARELRKGKKIRQSIWKKNREQEKKREEARKSILTECGIDTRSRNDIEKVLLYKECNRTCPYTGRSISMADLFNGSVEVEHIVPFSISLDNSFLNKTLCDRDANRQKGNRTPWEAFGHDEQRWHEITLRLKAFPGGMWNPKVHRFLSKEHPELENFTRQQLTDTSYASKAAIEYLGMLYGDEAKKCIQASRGGVTHFLRSEWDMNKLLGDGDKKNRDDHRHHAVDALAIALTDRRAMRLLSEAAVRASSERRRRFAVMETPWPDFFQEAREAVRNLVVSRRVDRRVSGPLHEETHYGQAKKEDGIVRVRKPVFSLSKKDFQNITDKAVREAVEAAYERLPKEDAKLLELEEYMPYLTTRDGRKIPIRKVRLSKNNAVLSVGTGDRLRHSVSGNNHHAEILEKTDGSGDLRWVVVSMFDAYQRQKMRQPVITRDHGPEWKFLYSLSSGEMVEMEDNQGVRRIHVCRGVSSSEIDFSPNEDARRKDEIKQANQLVRVRSAKSLIKQSIKKITITPLGEVRSAND